MIGSDGGYRLIDSGNQEKIERFGDYLLRRPSSQAVWRPNSRQAWDDSDARFERDRRGTGRWLSTRLPESWTMEFRGFTWTLRPNDHGNVGIFPEQASCWDWIESCIAAAAGRSDEPLEVLNLFGYTGGSTLAAARAGARVVHLDASKTSIAAARENAEASGLGDRPIRWITDDAVKFVRREFRRDRRYHGIILDPPTYGRGSSGEVWQIEEGITDLLDDCARLLADDARFVLFSSHSPGFTPLALANLLEAPADGRVESEEMVIEDLAGRPLPSGAFARWSR
ncbi:MAG: class I SAM-dependent methyltransferase [Planctomycetes bacterium]|nr:class I SAM-dependent methyltransferase [Planctomycetota bacterium]